MLCAWRKNVNEVLIILSTAIIVSLDSFMAGFSLSLNKKSNTALPATVALVTLLLCLLTTFVGSLLKNYLNETANVFGAVVLFSLAVLGLFRKDDKSCALAPAAFGENVAMGFAVGTDAAIANLSLAMSGYGIVAPLIFAVTHYFTVLLGQVLAKKATLENTNWFSSVILVGLAIMKLI